MSTILTDDFEAYTAGDLNGQGSWTGDAAFDVQTSVYHGGAKAVANTTSTGSAIRIDKTGSEITAGQVSVWMRVSATSNVAEAGLHLGDGVGQSDVRVRFNNGNIQYLRPDPVYWVTMGSYEADTWYNIVVQWKVYGNLIRYSMDGGETFSDWVDPWQSYTYLSNVAFQKDDSTGDFDFYFDDVADWTGRPTTCKVLVVAGGGGGGLSEYAASSLGGGGGAGGLLYDDMHSVATQNYSVTVGTGGLGAVGAINGTNSVFDDITSTGGGKGGGHAAGGATTGGGNGGSGGGSAQNGTGGGTGTAGQGYDGGDGSASTAGGGGGASAIGTAASGGTPGDGGNGTANSISGASVTYAAGGGGAGGNNGTGYENYGSGGQGTAYSGTPVNGKDGVVIVSYKTDGTDGISSSSTGGTKTTSGDYTIHTFISSGTFGCILTADITGTLPTATINLQAQPVTEFIGLLLTLPTAIINLTAQAVTSVIDNLWKELTKNIVSVSNKTKSSASSISNETKSDTDWTNQTKTL